MGVAWIAHEEENDSQDEKDLHVFSAQQERFWLKRIWWNDDKHQLVQPK